MSLRNACVPRQDILTGSFNPEIFTASLSAVTRYYQGHSTGIHSIYTDAGLFFREATYPTEGVGGDSLSESDFFKSCLYLAYFGYTSPLNLMAIFLKGSTSA